MFDDWLVRLEGLGCRRGELGGEETVGHKNGCGGELGAFTIVAWGIVGDNVGVHWCRDIATASALVF